MSIKKKVKKIAHDFFDSNPFLKKKLINFFGLNSSTITASEYRKIIKSYEASLAEANEILKSSEIAVYFFGSIRQTYKIKQWIDTFIELHKKHKLIIVVRDKTVYNYFKKLLPFPVKYCNTINQLLSFYGTTKPKSIFYITDGYKNFQSLIYEDALHVYLTHGESDKELDYSQQIKGYDYFFIYGDNGYNNYLKYIPKLKDKQLIKTGRPQLDFVFPLSIKTFDKKVILYAPAWETSTEDEKYTSIDILGDKIVDTLLNDNRYFLIYRPHPKLGTVNKEINGINKAIIDKIDKNRYARVIQDEDIYNIYPIVDFAIFDISSIMIDYLDFDKPFAITNINRYFCHYNILKASSSIDSENVDNFISIIDKEIENDSLKEEREKLKKFYLGDYKDGERIKAFIDSAINIIKKRDEEVKKRKDIEV